MQRMWKSSLTETERIDFKERIESRLQNEESITSLVKEVYTTARRDKCPDCETEQEDVKIDKPVSIVEGNYKLTPSEVRERLENPRRRLHLLGNKF